MAPDASAITEALGPARREPTFAEMIGALDVHDDDALGELIESDGRARVERGLPVDLNRYLTAVSDLAKRPVPLDAAIDVALRSLSGGSHITPQAEAALIARFPEFMTAIREATVLHEAVWSTTGLQRRMMPPPSKPLPIEFGPMLPNGQRRYILQEFIDQGAFGQVYKSLDRQLSEEGHTAFVAIKVFVSGEETSWDRRRLLEEATKVRRISHPNVVQVLDRGVSEQGEDYIVYEYVDGGDLSGCINRSPLPWPPRDAASLMARIARGVHAAHSAGVIHCDLKPGNILMTGDGQPKVTDFGVAIRIGEALMRLTVLDGEKPHSDRPIGNIAFISPEQYRGESGAISVQADIFALGGLLFFLLTGEFPNGASLSEIERNHDAQAGRHEAPAPRRFRPELDRDLDAICRRALAPESAQRHPSAAALAEDLEKFLRFEPVPSTGPDVFRIARLWVRRKPGLATMLAALLAVTIVGAAVAVYFGVDAAVSRRVNIKRQHDDLENAAKLKMLGQKYRLNTEILAQVWLLEWAFGPTVLNYPDSKARLWEDRINTVRWLMDNAQKDGKTEAMETLLRESALGFWLVCDGDYKESQPLLAGNLERWSCRLTADDPWLGDLRIMLACADANRVIDQSKQGHVDRSEGSELLRAAAELIRIELAVPDDHRGTPLHLLVIERLMTLHGPSLLNEPLRVDSLKKHKAELQKTRL